MISGRLAKVLLGASVVTALAAVAASQRGPQLYKGRPVLRITAPYLTIPFAESVIDHLDRIPRGPFYVLIDTYGGQVTAVAMLLKAMIERREEITALVPRLAFSGGTLLALCSRAIVAGPRAYFSPVDPQIGKCAAREIEDSPVAAQYSMQIAEWVDRLLALLVAEPARRDNLRSLFLGELVPHGWPLSASELAIAGLSLEIDRGLQ